MTLNQQERKFIIDRMGESYSEDLSDSQLIEWFKEVECCSAEEFEETLAEARDISARQAQLESYYS